MPTQNQYTQAVLKAQLVTADSGNELILCEQSGCDADWSEALCQYRQIQGALFCLEIGDYTSDTAVKLYNAMLEIAGLKYLVDVVPDPNAQLPAGIVINIDAGGAIDINYTQAFILDADPPNGNWYLPLIDPDTAADLPSYYKPTLVTVNGASFPATYDTNFTPARLYGFSSYLVTQNITVTFVTIL